MSNKTSAAAQAPRLKEVKVPAKLSSSKWKGIEFEPDVGPLGDSFVVVVGGNGLSAMSLTFHHPIGITQLEENDWVCTPTGEIQTLLDRAKRPDQEKVAKLRSAKRNDIAVAAGLLVRSDNALLYPGQKDGSRISVLETAKKAAKAAAKAKQTPKQIEKKAKIEFGPSDHLEYLGNYRDSELALVALWAMPETITAVEVAHPYAPYMTRSGPLADRDQVALEHLKGCTRQAAYDKTIQSIIKGTTK